MSLIVIPEFVIQEVLERLLKFVRDDYAEHSADTTKSYLHKVLVDAGFQRYQFFDQAIKVICGEEDDPRLLTVDLMFNFERNGAPTIHICLPAESPAGQGNGLGLDEGYQDPLYEDIDEDADPPEGGKFTPVYTRRYQAMYDIVVTSDNALEVILIYHFVRALLTANIFDFHQRNLQNISFSGQDIRPYEGLANNMFMRAIRMNVQYDTGAVSFHSSYMPNDVETVPQPTENLTNEV